ncbi:MAG: cupredoxin domain-containing protein [bacterium]
MIRKTAIALTIVASLFAVACGGSDTPADTTPTQSTPESKTVQMFGYKFNPNSLSVPAGTTVVFENKDPERHNVTISALGIDQMVDPGQSWSYTFTTTGEFAVANRLASNGMAATITVQ